VLVLDDPPAWPFDVRITTRYDEKVFMDAVMGTVHEVGHALYEQVRPGCQCGGYRGSDRS
jgi:Zn-dependent M32 family carboxypeptidase